MLIQVARKPFMLGPSSINHYPWKKKLQDNTYDKIDIFGSVRSIIIYIYIYIPRTHARTHARTFDIYHGV